MNRSYSTISKSAVFYMVEVYIFCIVGIWCINYVPVAPFTWVNAEMRCDLYGCSGMSFLTWLFGNTPLTFIGVPYAIGWCIASVRPTYDSYTWIIDGVLTPVKHMYRLLRNVTSTLWKVPLGRLLVSISILILIYLILFYDYTIFIR